MPPMFIDGRPPLVGATSIDASVSVTTPYIQHASGDKSLAVPAPATNDALALLTATQTMANKTLVDPVLQGATGMAIPASATLTNPIITSGVLTSPTIYGGTLATSVLSSPAIALTGGQMSGGIINYVVIGARNIAAMTISVNHTMDMSTADMFMFTLDAVGTLTVQNVCTGKIVKVIIKQLTNTGRLMSWMTGSSYTRGTNDTPPTASGGIYEYQIFFDGTRYYNYYDKTYV
jgi:hypothetical protein